MNRTLADLDRVVALGGGHGLGRVMSAFPLARVSPASSPPPTTADQPAVFVAQKAVSPGAICVTALTS